MNRKFQETFTRESGFKGGIARRSKVMLRNIEVILEEVLDRMGRLDGRKAVGPDEIAGVILKECREQLVLPAYDIIVSSLEEGKVPQDWNRAHIVPIYKGGKSKEALNYRPVSITCVKC